MTDKELLLESIEHWEELKKEGGDMSQNGCPLCQKYFNNGCKWCPVNNFTDGYHCRPTPHYSLANIYPDGVLPPPNMRTKYGSLLVEAEIKMLKMLKTGQSFNDWPERKGKIAKMITGDPNAKGITDEFIAELYKLIKGEGA